MENNENIEFMEGKRLNEIKCARFIKDVLGLAYEDKTFFSTRGRYRSEDELRLQIFTLLQDYTCTGVARKVENVLNVLRFVAAETKMDDTTTMLNVANGTFDIRHNHFMEQKYPCRYRLPVKFLREVEAPKRWLSFLNDLLEYDDIMTLQEYMGYCLIPSTKAQKMLIITGRGGEGKSRIGVVMRALLGETMNTGSLAKIESSPFARADLQHLLCMVDDDLKLEALPSTNHIKSIITAETPMDLEKKGMQSYQGRLYVRFMAFGNGTLQSLYDRSHGFFRRQIILSAKPRPTDRVDDPYLSEKLLEEIDGIFAWCLFGLVRLMENDFRFTVSAQAEENMEESKAEGNNIVEFMKSSGFFLYSTAGTITSRKFYDLYTQWCDDNAAKPLSSNSFCTYLRQEADFYGLRYTKHIDIGEGRQARGFTGILALQ